MISFLSCQNAHLRFFGAPAGDIPQSLEPDSYKNETGSRMGQNTDAAGLLFLAETCDPLSEAAHLSEQFFSVGPENFLTEWNDG
jgi:hypothetical protein